MPGLANVFQNVVADPFLLYTLLAAGFLAVVSLGSGWLRADFLALVRPQGLLRLSVMVVAAFLVVLLADALQARAGADASSVWLSALRGLSRFPLYVVTLAYGPSAGLLAAGLFAAFATASSLPGWPEVVLALELVVLGWFALAPSPRVARWAGPLDALLAYFLAWATGGAALLQGLSGDGAVLGAHLAYHQGTGLGVALSMALLFLVGPGVYERFFPYSRIVPQSSRPSPADAVDPAQERRVMTRGRRASDKTGAGAEVRGRRKNDAPALAAAEPARDAGLGSLEPHADAELVAPRDRAAPGAAAPALGDAPHDVQP